MRTTVDLPDELFRRAKAEAAMRGKKFKDLVEEALRLVIDKTSPGDKTEAAAAESKPKRITAHDLAKDLIFKDAEGPTDLSTNPQYFEDFGR
jgi:hypothetical protein